MHRYVPPRARPLVRFVVFHAADPLGIVMTVGHDRGAASLLASKRWKFSQQQLTVLPWDDCTREQQAAAAAEECTAADQLRQQVLR